MLILEHYRVVQLLLSPLGGVEVVVVTLSLIKGSRLYTYCASLTLYLYLYVIGVLIMFLVTSLAGSSFLSLKKLILLKVILRVVIT
jgi:hypothetical protein